MPGTNKDFPGNTSGKKHSSAPYSADDDTTPATLGLQREFSGKQCALIMALNIIRNKGRLRSDYHGLPGRVLGAASEKYDTLTVPSSAAAAVNGFLSELGHPEFVDKFTVGDGPDAAQVDHIIPKTKNGSNSFENAAVCSAQCNNALGNTMLQSLIDHFS